MKYWIGWGLIGLVGFIFLAQYDAGFVVIGWGRWTLETSFSLFIIMLVAIIVLIRLLQHGVMRSSKWLMRYFQHKTSSMN